MSLFSDALSVDDLNHQCIDFSRTAASFEYVKEIAFKLRKDLIGYKIPVTKPIAFLTGSVSLNSGYSSNTFKPMIDEPLTAFSKMNSIGTSIVELGHALDRYIFEDVEDEKSIIADGKTIRLNGFIGDVAVIGTQTTIKQVTIMNKTSRELCKMANGVNSDFMLEYNEEKEAINTLSLDSSIKDIVDGGSSSDSIVLLIAKSIGESDFKDTESLLQFLMRLNTTSTGFKYDVSTFKPIRAHFDLNDYFTVRPPQTGKDPMKIFIQYKKNLNVQVLYSILKSYSRGL